MVLEANGEEVLRERVANEAAALEALVDRVVELAGGPGRALWVIEADGGDGVVLIGELLARDELVAALTPTEVAVRRKGRRQVQADAEVGEQGMPDPAAAAVPRAVCRLGEERPIEQFAGPELPAWILELPLDPVADQRRRLRPDARIRAPAPAPPVTRPRHARSRRRRRRAAAWSDEPSGRSR